MLRIGDTVAVGEDLIEDDDLYPELMIAGCFGLVVGFCKDNFRFACVEFAINGGKKYRVYDSKLLLIVDPGRIGDHETKKILIKEADVDINIIPVVNWINSFDSAYTAFSCENLPYVLFYCHNTIDLVNILSKVQAFADVTVDFHSDSLRYNVRFAKSRDLDLFNMVLER